jgi:selenide,water dikinase
MVSLGPGVLGGAVDSPDLLVGAAEGDDAAVLRLDEERALVFTTDFFTPIVDDPGDWGRIAAANALSDVYAMGGRPVVALNLTAWPGETLPLSILADELRGGASVAASAGCLVVGGHTIDDPEPKYGLAVTGVVDPADVLTNAGGRAGDALVLTKPLGAGAVTTALKKGLADAEVLARAVEVMTELNEAGAAAAQAAGAHGMTDVTGFGLLGHLHELALESGVAAEVEAAAVPAIEGVIELLADDRALAGGSRNNRAYAEEFATFAGGVEEVRRRLVTDAMTSGGLLVALDPDRAGEVPGTVVGRLLEGEPGTIRVV